MSNSTHQSAKHCPDLIFRHCSTSCSRSIMLISETNMSSDDVTSDIVREVLIHVPIKPLLRFRRVCKEWQLLINDPVFAKLHYNFQRSHYKDMLLFRTTTNNGEFYTMYADSLAQSDTTTIEATKFTSCKDARIKFRCGPSCHGLVLLHPDTMRPLSLWKPLTGQLLYLPPPKLQGPYEYDGGGIGYLSASYEYKVVLISGQNTIIYSLKSQVWSLTKDFPYSQVFFYKKSGIFVNGAIYWCVHDMSPGGYIISFDLDTETYRKLSIPSSYGHCNLDVLDEHLFLTDYPELFPGSHSFNTWVLEDYGGEQYQWTKLISQEHGIYLPPKSIRPVAYMKSKNQVVLHVNLYTVGWFDVKDKKFVKKVNVRGPLYYGVLTGAAEGWCWNAESETKADVHKLKLKLESTTAL